MAIKSKREALSRQLPAKMRPIFRKHAQQTGQIMAASNILHSMFFCIFWTLVAKDNHALAHGLWHVLRSDKAQRDMVLVAAQTTLKKNRRLLVQIKWAKERADDLATHRNDPVHTTMFPVDTDGRPELWLDMFAAKKASLDRLTQTPTDHLWQRTCGDLTALYRYCGHIFLALALPDEHLTLPKRPQLQAVRQTKGAHQKSHPQGKGQPASRHQASPR